MDETKIFKERFKNRTQIITKFGIEKLSTMNPIDKSKLSPIKVVASTILGTVGSIGLF